jgi:hypothetical protein
MGNDARVEPLESAASGGPVLWGFPLHGVDVAKEGSPAERPSEAGIAFEFKDLELVRRCAPGAQGIGILDKPVREIAADVRFSGQRV